MLLKLAKYSAQHLEGRFVTQAVVVRTPGQWKYFLGSKLGSLKGRAVVLTTLVEPRVQSFLASLPECHHPMRKLNGVRVKALRAEDRVEVAVVDNAGALNFPKQWATYSLDYGLNGCKMALLPHLEDLR